MLSAELQPTPPLRPLAWPAFIDVLASAAGSDAAHQYLVGGVVRDALLGIPSKDIDIVTAGDGLKEARRLANRLGGAYYPADEERGTGRIILKPGTHSEAPQQIDVSSLRGQTLLQDLQGRDFTINAAAAPLQNPDLIIDPLGGQVDLLQARRLYLCSPTSLRQDPIRALRAVRMGLQFRLRLADDVRAEARSVGPLLEDSQGGLHQPERVRDEFFKLLEKTSWQAALRLMHTLGLLKIITPAAPEDVEAALNLAAQLEGLLTIISRKRDDNAGANLTLGVAVMILDRYRAQLQLYLAEELTQGRRRGALLALAALTPADMAQPGRQWAARLNLARAEEKALDQLSLARVYPWPADHTLSDRAVYHYFQAAQDMGTGGALINLADFLRRHWPQPEPAQWGDLLEYRTAPILEAYFNRYHEVVDPPLLLNGTDLSQQFNLPPGPIIGRILAALKEEQAAGAIKTYEEARTLVTHLLEAGNNK